VGNLVVGVFSFSLAIGTTIRSEYDVLTIYVLQGSNPTPLIVFETFEVWSPLWKWSGGGRGRQ
jgi:hypothetical protein